MCTTNHSQFPATGNICNSTDHPFTVTNRGSLSGIVPYSVAISGIGIFGTFGNLLFLLSFIKERRLRTVSNYLIGHLALVDMLTCCVTVPWNLIITSGTTSIASCQYATRMFFLFPHLSMQTQCLISCNRYFLVTKTRLVYQKWFGKIGIIFYLGLGWILSFVVIIFIALFGEKPLDPEINYCDTNTDVTGSRMLSYYLLGFSGIIYFAIALVFYGKLIWFVRYSPMPLDAVRKRDSKTSITLLFLLTIYAVSLLVSPLVLYINSIYKDKSNETPLDAVDQIVSCVLVMNYCVNPIFYGLRIRYFKEAVKRMLMPCRTTNIHPTDNGVFVVAPLRYIDTQGERLTSRQRST